MKNTIVKYLVIALIVGLAAFTGGTAGSGGGISDLFKLATDEAALVKTCETLVKDGKVTVTTTVTPAVTVEPAPVTP